MDKRPTSRPRLSLPLARANEVHTHVAVAVLRALRVVSEGEARAGLAFPDNTHRRRQVGDVKPSLDQLGIAVSWVDAEHGVTVESRHALRLSPPDGG